MTQTPRDRADVHTCGDQLGSRVVPQLVNRGLDAEPSRQPTVPLGHRVGLEVRRPVDRRGEDERVAGECHADGLRSRGAAGAVRGQQRDRLGIECQPSLLVGLGPLLPGAAAALPDAALELDDTSVEVEVPPAQTAELATANR